MVSKLSWFLGCPFRPKGVEVSVELLTFPFPLSSGGSWGTTQVLDRESVQHKYPAQRTKWTKQKMLYLCWVILSGCVTWGKRLVWERPLRWTLEAQVLPSSHKSPTFWNPGAAQQCQGCPGCRRTLGHGAPVAAHSAAVTPTEMQLHTGRHLESAQMARPLPCSSPCCRSSALSSRDTSSAACPAAHKSRPCTLGK